MILEKNKLQTVQEWTKSYIELIALYVLAKNSNHLRSQVKAILVLDHSRLGLVNKFLEIKSDRIFWVRQVYLQNLANKSGVCKPTFYPFDTSNLRWNSTMRRCLFHTDLWQNAVFHNFAIQTALIRYSGRSKNAWAFSRKPLKIFPKSPIRPVGAHFWQAPNSQCELSSVWMNINRVTLQH